jgi:DNA-binding response OmpR family regulator
MNGAQAGVLLIEDDAVLGAVTTNVLQYLDYDVTWSESANAGFDALMQNGSFAAVLLDLELGTDDGVALIWRLRSHGYELPPVIVYSGQPVNILQHAAREIGAVAILQKPCSAAQLAQALYLALDRQRDGSVAANN